MLRNVLLTVVRLPTMISAVTQFSLTGCANDVVKTQVKITKWCRALPGLLIAILLASLPAPAQDGRYSTSVGIIGKDPQTMTRLNENNDGEAPASFYEAL